MVSQRLPHAVPAMAYLLRADGLVLRDDAERRHRIGQDGDTTDVPLAGSAPMNCEGACHVGPILRRQKMDRNGRRRRLYSYVDIPVRILVGAGLPGGTRVKVR